MSKSRGNSLTRTDVIDRRRGRISCYEMFMGARTNETVDMAASKCVARFLASRLALHDETAGNWDVRQVKDVGQPARKRRSRTRR